MDNLFVATSTNSGHISKFCDLIVSIVAIGDRETVVNAILQDVNDLNEYMFGDDYTTVLPVTEADLVFTETTYGQEYVYSSEELAQTWTLTQYTNRVIKIL